MSNARIVSSKRCKAEAKTIAGEIWHVNVLHAVSENTDVDKIDNYIHVLTYLETICTFSLA